MDHRRITAKTLQTLRDKTARKMTIFNDRVLETVEYRASLDPTPDGFPTNTRYGPRSGGPSVGHDRGCAALKVGEALVCSCGADGGEEVSTSTERAALRLIDGHLPRDPQQKACERIDVAFRAIWREIEAAEHAWDVILHASESIRTREAQSTLGTCQACLRDDVPNVGNDRIRAGYCQPCFMAWYRTDKGSGRQDRKAFETDRRRLRLVEGENPRRTGYEVDELDGLVAAGVLPPKHVAAEPTEAV